MFSVQSYLTTSLQVSSQKRQIDCVRGRFNDWKTTGGLKVILDKVECVQAFEVNFDTRFHDRFCGERRLAVGVQAYVPVYNRRRPISVLVYKCTPFYSFVPGLESKIMERMGKRRIRGALFDQ